MGAPEGNGKKQDRRGSTDWVRLTAAVLFFGLGLSLLVLAVPRAVGAITFAQRSMTRAELLTRPHPAAELAQNVRIIEDALRWTSPTEYLFTLSLFEYQLALTFPPGSRDRTSRIEQAEQHTISELKVSPADGYAWVWLAVMRQARGAPPRDILDPLITSLDVAPNRRDLWTSRMNLLMYYWSVLKPNELPIVRHQIRTMWSVPQFQFFLYNTALTYEGKFNLVDTLRGDPEALNEIATFDRNMAYP